MFLLAEAEFKMAMSVMHFARLIDSARNILKDACKKSSFGGYGRWGKLCNMWQLCQGGKGRDDISSGPVGYSPTHTQIQTCIARPNNETLLWFLHGYREVGELSPLLLLAAEQSPVSNQQCITSLRKMKGESQRLLDTLCLYMFAIMRKRVLNLLTLCKVV